jgi:hypothetical protein
MGWAPSQDAAQKNIKAALRLTKIRFTGLSSAYGLVKKLSFLLGDVKLGL